VLPYARLVRLLTVLCQWEMAPWTATAATRFAALRKSRLRVGTQDLKIAAIALEHDALLLSANLRDFEQVPGLSVENWLS
jgi:tRNA(fMet)-specific endonuclease VapC